MVNILEKSLLKILSIGKCVMDAFNLTKLIFGAGGLSSFLGLMMLHIRLSQVEKLQGSGYFFDKYTRHYELVVTYKNHEMIVILLLTVFASFAKRMKSYSWIPLTMWALPFLNIWSEQVVNLIEFMATKENLDGKWMCSLRLLFIYLVYGCGAIYYLNDCLYKPASRIVRLGPNNVVIHIHNEVEVDDMVYEDYAAEEPVEDDLGEELEAATSEEDLHGAMNRATENLRYHAHEPTCVCHGEDAASTNDSEEDDDETDIDDSAPESTQSRHSHTICPNCQYDRYTSEGGSHAESSDSDAESLPESQSVNESHEDENDSLDMDTIKEFLACLQDIDNLETPADLNMDSLVNQAVETLTLHTERVLETLEASSGLLQGNNADENVEEKEQKGDGAGEETSTQLNKRSNSFCAAGPADQAGKYFYVDMSENSGGDARPCLQRRATGTNTDSHPDFTDEF